MPFCSSFNHEKEGVTRKMGVVTLVEKVDVEGVIAGGHGLRTGSKAS